MKLMWSFSPSVLPVIGAECMCYENVVISKILINFEFATKILTSINVRGHGEVVGEDEGGEVDLLADVDGDGGVGRLVQQGGRLVRVEGVGDRAVIGAEVHPEAVPLLHLHTRIGLQLRLNVNLKTDKKRSEASRYVLH